jgi:hypothetical protein
MNIILFECILKLGKLLDVIVSSKKMHMKGQVIIVVVCTQCDKILKKINA